MKQLSHVHCKDGWAKFLPNNSNSMLFSKHNSNSRNSYFFHKKPIVTFNRYFMYNDYD